MNDRLKYIRGKVVGYALALILCAPASLGMGSCGSKDTVRRVNHDTGKAEGTAANIKLDITPPGSSRGGRYRGLVRFMGDRKRPVFAKALSISALSHNKNALQNIHVVIRNEREAAIECDVSPDANTTELIVLSVRYPQRTETYDLYLRVVDEDWDPSWRPTAVAPPDTAVSAGTMVILDATASRHPAGLNAMTFLWIINDGKMLVGDNITSFVLPAGTHTIVLIAEDRFGNVSNDTMIVHVDK